MANHHGSEGVVKSGTNALAEVTSFEITETAEFAEDTTLGDTQKTRNTTAVKDWNGSLECFWDETDTNGQVTLTCGANVTLKLAPEGYSQNDTYLSGTALITERTISSARGGIVTARISFVGTGALTTTTVP
jgi:hypothetical protein